MILISSFKTLERVGVIATKANALKIFNEIISLGYGQEGYLNYRNYARKVYNPASFEYLDNQVHKPLATSVYEGNYQDYCHPGVSDHQSEKDDSPSKTSAYAAGIKRSGYKEPSLDTLESIIEELKQRVKVRGPQGQYELLYKFQIVDSDNQGCVNKWEFSKILREYDLNLLDNQYEILFDSYDFYKDGNINFRQFMSKIKLKSLVLKPNQNFTKY